MFWMRNKKVNFLVRTLTKGLVIAIDMLDFQSLSSMRFLSGYQEYLDHTDSMQFGSGFIFFTNTSVTRTGPAICNLTPTPIHVQGLLPLKSL